MQEKEGKLCEALNLFLRGGVPARAADLVMKYGAEFDTQEVEKVVSSLHSLGMYEKAGELHAARNEPHVAIKEYRWVFCTCEDAGARLLRLAQEP